MEKVDILDMTVQFLKGNCFEKPAGKFINLTLYYAGAGNSLEISFSSVYLHQISFSILIWQNSKENPEFVAIPFSTDQSLQKLTETTFAWLDNSNIFIILNFLTIETPSFLAYWILLAKKIMT